MTPGDAYKAYSDAEKVAADVFREYWRDKFDKVGVPFIADGWAGMKCSFQGYELSAYVWPRTHDGVDIRISRPHPNSIGSLSSVKVRSDSGFAKLLRNLHRQKFL